MCYFLSSRSVSADKLASELILAISDQFPKVECLGVLGEWSSRTRSTKLADLNDALKLGLHSNKQETEAGKHWLAELIPQLNDISPQVAILVGYSSLHHQLAHFFNQLAVPVVLYDITPDGALDGIPLEEVAGRVAVSLGTSKSGSEFIRSAGISYHYIGSPHKDRVNRVVVAPESLGFTKHSNIVSIFPGSQVGDFQSTMPLFQKIAEELSKSKKHQVVLSVSEAIIEDPHVTLFGHSLKEVLAAPKAQLNNIRVLVEMHLEILSMSALAITGCGAITVECGLFNVPFIPIFPAGQSDKLSSHCMLNQIVDEAIVEEYSSDIDYKALFKVAKNLLSTGPTRNAMVAELKRVASSIHGFAAENAADYIGREIAQWRPGKRSGNGHLTA